MARPRKEQISISDTPYYHIVSRCVRRTFLCGFDKETQQSYEHRKQWIVDRIRLLSSLFTVDLCSYAVMSNHYHLVVKITPEQSDNWTNREIAERWTSIYQGPLIIQKWLSSSSLSEAEKTTINSIIAIWRKRLCSISWFMKCLNEPIARLANKEDDCTGHFWESRFKSQALLSENALLACMVYVDLNPIRAGISKTPESSDYTSVQERVSPKWSIKKAINEQSKETFIQLNSSVKPLHPFKNKSDIDPENKLPMTFIGYIELVDWTGRIIREDKHGYISENTPPIVKRLNLENQSWLIQTTKFEENYRRNSRRKIKQNTS